MNYRNTYMGYSPTTSMDNISNLWCTLLSLLGGGVGHLSCTRTSLPRCRSLYLPIGVGVPSLSGQGCTTLPPMVYPPYPLWVASLSTGLSAVNRVDLLAITQYINLTPYMDFTLCTPLTSDTSSGTRLVRDLRLSGKGCSSPMGGFGPPTYWWTVGTMGEQYV